MTTKLINLTSRQTWKCSEKHVNAFSDEQCKVETCRRKKPTEKKLPGMQIVVKNPHTGETEYHTRFSEAFQPEGHDFVKAFEVLRLVYWMIYDLITDKEIALYETLLVLSKHNIPFTIEKLADKMKIGDVKLRKLLDNLINAELLSEYQSDGQGRPYLFILRTPYFERDSIEGDSKAVIARQDRILFDKKGDKLIPTNRELPKEFIEDHVERLREKIKINEAEIKRKILNGKDLAAEFKHFKELLKDEIENQKVVWFKIIKKIGKSKTNDIDGELWQLSRSTFADSNAQDFNSQLKNKIKKYLKQLDISLDSTNQKFLIDHLVELYYFYEPKTGRRNKPEASANPPTNAGNNFDDETPELRSDNGENTDARSELLRLKLVYKNSTIQEYNRKYGYADHQLRAFAKIVREYGANLPTADIEKIVVEIFGQKVWKQISDEMKL